VRTYLTEALVGPNQGILNPRLEPSSRVIIRGNETDEIAMSEITCLITVQRASPNDPVLKVPRIVGRGFL